MNVLPSMPPLESHREVAGRVRIALISHRGFTLHPASPRFTPSHLMHPCSSARPVTVTRRALDERRARACCYSTEQIHTYTRNARCLTGAGVEWRVGVRLCEEAARDETDIRY